MNYKELYESWLANPYFDEETKRELMGIAEDENEIKERFYADLEFGTAGYQTGCKYFDKSEQHTADDSAPSTLEATDDSRRESFGSVHGTAVKAYDSLVISEQESADRQ